MKTLEYAIKGAVAPPAAEAIINGLPLAVPGRNLAPLGARVQQPKDAIKNPAMILPLTAPATIGWQKIRNQSELGRG